MRLGFPPMRVNASRMVARSTTAGTPVKSCSNTRAGIKAISFSAECGFQEASASMSAGCTKRPSSQRSKFSSRMRREKGSLLTWPIPFFSRCSSRRISKLWAPTCSVSLVPKEFAAEMDIPAYLSRRSSLYDNRIPITRRTAILVGVSLENGVFGGSEGRTKVRHLHKTRTDAHGFYEYCSDFYLRAWAATVWIGVAGGLAAQARTRCDVL